MLAQAVGTIEDLTGVIVLAFFKHNARLSLPNRRCLIRFMVSGDLIHSQLASRQTHHGKEHSRTKILSSQQPGTRAEEQRHK